MPHDRLSGFARVHPAAALVFVADLRTVAAVEDMMEEARSVTQQTRSEGQRSRGPSAGVLAALRNPRDTKLRWA